MNFDSILAAIALEVRPLFGQGKIANYIPALARVPNEQFGIALRTSDGLESSAADAQVPFSIQSISKVFTLTLAMRELGDQLWERLGREPSGDPFNSLIQLEHEQGVPRNPFINAGAIVVADRLISRLPDAKRAVRDFVSMLCGEDIGYDEEVARSEAQTGFRNVALANFIKSFGKLDNPVDEVLDLYFHQCALSMSCVQLARAFAYLCRDGKVALRDHNVLNERQTRRINALMLTCGTYDAAGEFAFRIGLPSKSGVGGGIVAVLPDRLTVCVWSPELGPSGNSFAGMRALELFVEKTKLSVF
ncbi:MAG TPA: glutaminase [Polyangiales bacterium]|nr:glutaminase [Polyangiales bacterium]